MNSPIWRFPPFDTFLGEHAREHSADGLLREPQDCTFDACGRDRLEVEVVLTRCTGVDARRTSATRGKNRHVLPRVPLLMAIRDKLAQAPREEP